MLFKLKGSQIVKALAVIIFSTLLINGCSKDVPPTAVKGGGDFAVYMLKDQSLKFSDVYNKPVSSLELMKKPWLTSSDISMYDFSSHYIYLKKNRAEMFAKKEGVGEPQMNMPFVVTANGKAVYAGYFTSPISSYMAGAPSIQLLDFFYAEDIIHIGNAIFPKNDLREDESIKMALIKDGIYKGGVKASISSISIVNDDVATVNYKLTLTNNSGEPLYVLDPDKTGSSLFHYFTNGPSFYNVQNKTTNWSQYKQTATPSPYNQVLPGWFVLLKVNQSITRNVSLKGYSRFEKGDYEVNMQFANPFVTQKENRVLNNNSIWLGSTNTEMVYFTFN